MTGEKPDLSKVRIVEMPPRKVEPPPPVPPDHGAIFVLERYWMQRRQRLNVHPAVTGLP